ncbi:hypothetical protein ABZP36_004494 [Zizania latifolia]
MDGSSSIPLPHPSPPPPSPPAPQVFLRRSVPPLPPPHRGPAPPAPDHVHYFRTASSIPIYSPRLPGPRAAASRPPRPPPTAAPVAPPRPPAPSQMTTLPPPQQPAAAVVLPPDTTTKDVAAPGTGNPTANAPDNEEKSGRESIQSEVSKGETEQGPDKESTTGTIKGIKRQRKPKGFKQGSLRANEGDAGPSLFSPNNCRYDSSLGLLTKKFITLLQGAEDGTLDLNKAAETLEVQKRRIYDITNVLEGVDLIEKKLKNMIHWKGFDMSKPKERERQISALKEEIDSLYDEDSRLDDEIMEAQEKLNALIVDEHKRKLLYIAKEDINRIPRFQGSTLIAINAPRGTYIEVPDPNADMDIYKDMDIQEKHYQIVLRSVMGPVDCFLISNNQETFNPDQQMVKDNLDAVVTSGSSHVPHQMDYVPSEAPEMGESNAVREHTSEPSKGNTSVPGILKIVPSDADAAADYWLASDVNVSMTDTWGT